MNWGQVILPGKCPVTNDRENHQPSMLSRLKAQNTWWFSLTDRDVDETSEDKFHSLLGNSHQIRITIYIPFARDMLVTGLGDTTILPKPPSIPISHEVTGPILHFAWIRGHGGWSIWICQALKWAEHRQGQGDEESKEQNAIQVEDLWMLSTHLSNLSTHLPQIIKSLMTFGVDRHLLGKKNNCKVCMLQTLGLWNQILEFFEIPG